MTAASVGLLAGIDARLGIAAAFGVIFVAVVIESLLAGVAIFAILTYIDAVEDVGPLSLVKVAGALLVVSWAALTLTRERDELWRSRPLLTYALVAFLGWTLMSAAWAESSGASWSAFARYAPNLVLFVVVYTAVRCERDLVIVVLALTTGAAVAASVGLVSSPGEADPTSIDSVARATGTVGDANELAAAGVVGTMLAAGLAAGYREGRRALLIAIAGVCLVSVFISLSRGGLVALAATVLLAAIAGGPWRPYAVAFAIAIALTGVGYFGAIASPEARERVTGFESSTGRSELWTIAARMVEDRPLAGVGAGNFPIRSVDYLLEPGETQVDDYVILRPQVTHNTYLQVASELGLVGLALFMSVIGASLWCMSQAARTFARAGNRAGEAISRGVLLAATGNLVAGVFISDNYSNLFWLLLALGPAALNAAHRAAATEGRSI